MIRQAIMGQVIEEQAQKAARSSSMLSREVLSEISDVRSHALIVSGIRRCGKSTLLLQLLGSDSRRSLYLNFEDPRLSGFELEDFQLLDNIIGQKKCEALYFDEIQVVDRWELYVRQKLDEGFKVVVTGSNASLLSRELGTKLTGRHITKELYPFSYREFLAFKSLQAGEKSFQKYMTVGGFPEFVKTGNRDIMTALFYDILNRDIAVRHNIRDVNQLKRLAVYLFSNVGNLVTATRLQQPLNISTATILEYFSFMEDTYLVAFLPKFSYSYRAQLVNPRKIYAVDPGIIKIASVSFTDNRGHLLENLIYWELRRQGKELYYFNENGAECDFVVMQNGKAERVVQVCYELSPENRQREQRGLHEAMKFFDTANGMIVTCAQRDAYMQDGKQIDVIPAYEFLTRQK